MSRIPRIGALAAGKDPADSLITRVMDLSQMTNDLGPDKSGVLGSDAHRIHRDHSASMLLAHLCCSVVECPQARGLLWSKVEDASKVSGVPAGARTPRRGVHRQRRPRRLAGRPRCQFYRKRTTNPMVPSFPKVGYSTIEGGGESSTKVAWTFLTPSLIQSCEDLSDRPRDRPEGWRESSESGKHIKNGPQG